MNTPILRVLYGFVLTSLLSFFLVGCGADLEWEKDIAFKTSSALQQALDSVRSASSSSSVAFVPHGAERTYFILAPNVSGETTEYRRLLILTVDPEGEINIGLDRMVDHAVWWVSPNAEVIYVAAIVYEEVNAKTIYRLYRSDDFGRSFTTLDWDKDLNNQHLVFINDQEGYILGDQLFRTLDGGDHWERLNVTGLDPQSMMGLHIDPESKRLYFFQNQSSPADGQINCDNKNCGRGLFAIDWQQNDLHQVLDLTPHHERIFFSMALIGDKIYTLSIDETRTWYLDVWENGQYLQVSQMGFASGYAYFTPRPDAKAVAVSNLRLSTLSNGNIVIKSIDQGGNHELNRLSWSNVFDSASSSTLYILNTRTNKMWEQDNHKPYTVEAYNALSYGSDIMYLSYNGDIYRRLLTQGKSK